MTYLGTRPPTVDEWDKYELHHRARLATKPGLTGMWQVSYALFVGDSSSDTITGLMNTELLPMQMIIFLIRRYSVNI